jgi:hypothetical protein
MKGVVEGVREHGAKENSWAYEQGEVRHTKCKMLKSGAGQASDRSQTAIVA